MSFSPASISLTTFSLYLCFVLSYPRHAGSIVPHKSIMVNAVRGIDGQHSDKSTNNTHDEKDLIKKHPQREDSREGGKKLLGNAWTRGANYTTKWVLSQQETEKLQTMTKTMYPSDRHELYTIQLLQQILKSFDHYGINYFTHGISLFGVYKHLGAVPFVDDFYLAANGQQLDGIRRLISDISVSNVEIRGNGPFVLRMGQDANDSMPVPRIHLSLYYESDSYIWINRSDLDRISSIDTRFTFKKSDVLPFRVVPYYGVKVPVPCNTAAVLSEYFDIRNCYINNGINNIFDSNSLALKILDCDLLCTVYPVMKRKRTKFYTVGFLEFNKTVIETTVTPHTC